MWRVISANDDVPQVLESLDLPGVAKYIQSEACNNIFVMAGAGISTAAGIPDFRSPDTGLYANLARLKLPYPEAVFDINFFRRNPVPFYTLAHELAPGKYRPTLTHAFIRLLTEKELLHTCFTQNIDTLERRAGVPASKIVEAHGSFADQHCIECGAPYPDDKMKQAIEKKEIARCGRKGCRGLVKPDIVFFGESLPPQFHASIRHLRSADLVIVMGTSLTVHPFASLPELVPEDCPRLLCNLDHVGGWGSRVNDVAVLMKVDDAVRELSRLLGWEDELLKLWKEVGGEGEPEAAGDDEGKEEEAGKGAAKAESKKTAEETVEEAVEELARVIGEVKIDDESGGTKSQVAQTSLEDERSSKDDTLWSEEAPSGNVTTPNEAFSTSDSAERDSSSRKPEDECGSDAVTVADDKAPSQARDDGESATHTPQNHL